ncbi:hypothetical protein WNY37_07970 [Henriciella sp. AS95]|uniref:DoxX family protein n=1 Tax=Henriciella sp. AS95 TaxID=3135782 RepID=UPI00317A2E9A
MHWVAILIIAAWMLIGGAAHMIAPEPFFAIVPDWMPELAVVYISGIVEIVIGIAVLMPRTRSLAGLAFALLCAGYLPLHIWDFIRPDPVFSVPWSASLRILIQMGLIALGLWLWRRGQTPAGT